MPPILKAIDLYCERDERALFSNLCITVNTGDILHLKGPNGAGKTTLLRALAGLSQLVEGELCWSEKVSENTRQLLGECFWYLAHKPAVTLVQTPLENLAFHLALHNVNHDETVLWAALNEVGLRGYEDVPCHQLSAGQQRRVALARLYVDVPSIQLWILDEPFTALDVSAVAQLEQRMFAYVQNGGAIIMTSHHGLSQSSVHVLNLEAQS